MTFLGASIRKVNLSLGWGTQPSTLTVNLIEDRRNGDRFNAPLVGNPVRFELPDNKGYTWSFEGFLQKKQRFGSSEGNPLYQVDIIDPRELLDGVPLILSQYTGPSQINNMMNVFGYLNEQGQVRPNQAGLPWNIVRNTIDDLSRATSPFGGPIFFSRNQFITDLRNLPIVPNDYRVTGNDMSILGFVEDICALAGHDFYFRLEGNVIRVFTIPRNRNPEFGMIDEFITNTEGASSKSVGEELRLGATSRFILGADIHQMYARGMNPGTQGSFIDDTIWPYWGTYDNGNAILSTVLGANNQSYDNYWGMVLDDRNTLALDSRTIDVIGVGSTYLTDIEELRAAETDIDTWMGFLDFNSGNKFVPDAEGSRDGVYYAKYSPMLNIVTTSVMNWESTEHNGQFMSWEQYYVEAGISENARAVSRTGRNNAKKRAIEFLGDENLANDILKEANSQKEEFFLIRKLAPIAGDWHPLLHNRIQAAFTLKNINLKFNLLSNLILQIKAAMKNEASVLAATSFAGPLDPVENNDGTFFAGYKHRGVINIHYGKSYLMRFSTEFSPQLIGALQGSIHNVNTVNLQNYSPFNLSISRLSSSENFDAMQDMYDFVANYANNFYGRKFMVRVPEIMSIRQPIGGEIWTNYSVADGGFLSEQQFANAVQSGLVPQNRFHFTLEDGRFTAYVRFDVPPNVVQSIRKQDDFQPRPQNIAQYYDISDLSPDEFYVTPNGFSIFVKCDVDNELVYLDANSLFSPRVVITLPAKIRTKWSVNDNSTDITSNFIPGLASYALDDNQREQAMSSVTNLKDRIGNDAMQASFEHPAAPPLMAMFPLKSNERSYGPFFVNNSSGRVEFEKDEQLAPWVYGSYELMNQAGNAKATAYTSSQLWDESGQITVPGLPNLDIGGQLNGIGPYITNVSVDISESGVSTTYSMQTWISNLSRNFERLNERLKRLTRANQQMRRNNLAMRQIPGFGSKFYSARKFANVKPHTKYLKSNSSHHMISANQDTTVIQPIYNMVTQLSTDYVNTASVSLNALFTPFAFSGNSNLTQLESNMYGFGASQLLPNYDNNVIVTAGDLPPGDSLQAGKSEGIRSVGFKSPIIMTGPAYNQYHEAYKSDVIHGGAGHIIIGTFDNNIPDGNYYNVLTESNGEGEGLTVAFKVTEGVPSAAIVVNRGGGYEDGEEVRCFVDRKRVNFTISQTSSYYVTAEDFHSDKELWKAGPLELVYDENRNVWSPNPVIVVETIEIINRNSFGACYVKFGPPGLEEYVIDNLHEAHDGKKIIFCYNNYSRLRAGVNAYAMNINGYLCIFSAPC